MNENNEEVKDKVKHFIEPPAIHISDKMTVLEACKRMKKHQVDAILVSEGEKFVGIFTDADLLNKVVADNELADDTPIFNVMTKKLVYIDSDASMILAFVTMQTKDIRHLVVKQGEEVIGVLSIKDIANYYVHKFSHP